MIPQRFKRISHTAAAFAILAFVIPLIVAATVVSRAVPTYEASTWVIMNPRNSTLAIAGKEEDKVQSEQISYDQILKSQLSIILSDDVVRSTVEKIGMNVLYPGSGPSNASSEVDLDRIVAIARSNLSATSEANTYVFKISFRHPNPRLAAEFSDAVVDQYFIKRAKLYSNPTAEGFFAEQEKDFTDKLVTASSRLEQFSASRGLFDVSEQRKLLLERRSDAEKMLGISRGNIKKVDGEIDTYRTGISSLKLKLSLPAEIYGNNNFGTDGKGVARQEAYTNDPPLLNIKLYQQMAEKLVNSNAELAGLQSLERQQISILKSIESQLTELSRSEATFLALQRDVSRYENYINSLSRRAIDARINGAWGSNSNFSGAQVLQKASVPNKPVFPQPVLIITAGILTGLICSSCVLYIFFLSNGLFIVRPGAQFSTDRDSSLGGDSVFSQR